MDAEVRRYPLDYDALEKGSVISRQELEDITGCKYGTKDFDLKSLGLVDLVEQELEQRNLRVTARMEKGNMLILDDAAASRYNTEQAMRGFSRMTRRHRKLQTVDVGLLTDTQCNDHTRSVAIIGSMVLAARKAKRETLKALPHIPSTPSLPSPTQQEQ